MEEIKCPLCGSTNSKQIDGNTYQCSQCEKTFIVQQVSSSQESVSKLVEETPAEINDSPGILMNSLCFLIPIVGIVMYFIKKKKQPKCAKSYLIWGLMGIGGNLLTDLFL